METVLSHLSSAFWPLRFQINQLNSLMFHKSQQDIRLASLGQRLCSTEAHPLSIIQSGMTTPQDRHLLN